jgi:uncharacterized membrane protein YfcA
VTGVSPHRQLPIGLAATGLGAGVLSGLFGVGGGIVMVPVMVLLLGIVQRRAQATSLAAIVPIAAVGALVFGRADNLDLGAATVLIVGALVGVWAAGAVLPRVSDARLRQIFGALMAAVAVAMFL